MGNESLIEEVQNIVWGLKESFGKGCSDYFESIEESLIGKLDSLDFLIANDPWMDSDRRETGRTLFKNLRTFLVEIRERLDSRQ